MAGSAGDNSGTDPLERMLRDVEAELRDRLRAACEAEASGFSTESALDIRRLEDSLLAAAVAAEQTITLRRRIKRDHASTAEQAPSPDASLDEPNAPPIKLREFRDAEGRLWRAWPVTPRQARPGRSGEQYLGEFHKGWICFEALESSARRRLPNQPERWTELKDPELCQLLEQAIKAPERKRQRAAEDDSPRPSLH
jgi:hypothetical protein